MTPPFVRLASPPAPMPPSPMTSPSPVSFADSGFGYAPMWDTSEEESDLRPLPGLPAPSASPLPPVTTKTAVLYPKPPKPYKGMTDYQAGDPKGYAALQEQVQAVHAQNDQFINLDHVRSPQHIIDHWNQTTEEHRKQGMSWYADAHQAAVTIAKDKNITLHQAAGLIANYSPKQHWAQNLRMASITAGGHIIGGPKDPNDTGEGFNASGKQAAAAKRILAGEDYHDVFKGRKITNFADLIEHGTDPDPAHQLVVIDRHALGVAHGTYADEGIFKRSGVSNTPSPVTGKAPVYDDVSRMYQEAADHINANGGYNGQPIAAHQLQAATWLTRQRLNAEGGYTDVDEDGESVSGETAKKVALTATQKWNEYAAVNHPTLVNKVPGSGFSAAVGQGGLADDDDQGVPQQAPAGSLVSSRVIPQFVRRR